MEVTLSNFDKNKLKIGPKSVWYGKYKYTKDIGHCRRVYRIGNVVIKFDFSKKKQQENGGGEAYKQTYEECRFYRKIKKEDKKYFPRTKALRINDQTVELQEYIEGEIFSLNYNKKAQEIVSRLQKDYDKCDYHAGNVVVREDKTPVVVDFGF